MFICLLNCLFIYSFIYLFIDLFVHLFIVVCRLCPQGPLQERRRPAAKAPEARSLSALSSSCSGSLGTWRVLTTTIGSASLDPPVQYAADLEDPLIQALVESARTSASTTTTSSRPDILHSSIDLGVSLSQPCL